MRDKEIVAEVNIDNKHDQNSMPDIANVDYRGIAVKPAFTVQATYKFIGKLKPRQFPLDE